MEDKLSEIRTKFQSGIYKEAINDLRRLIDDHPNDSSISVAYDKLGDYLNYIGEHCQAIESYKKCLEHLHIDNDDQDLVTSINVSVQIARISYQLGRDGPGYSRKSNRVTFVPTKMTEEEKQEWVNNQLSQSVAYFRQSLIKFPENLQKTKAKIQAELASVLLYTEKYDEAVEIYENGFHNYGEVDWIYKAAHCLWQQEKKELAFSRLQQLIEADSTYAEAYKILRVYYEEKDDQEKAFDAKQKYEFYSWIPKFCHHIEFNEENCSILQKIRSSEGLECLKTTLANDASRRSTEFLASICYHHYHGIMDDTAFHLLENRGVEINDEEEKDFIRNVLMYLVEHCRSNCTIRGATSALAAMKHQGLFEILAKLIYKDTNFHYPMNIASSLGQLQDPRAIPLLMSITEKPLQCLQNDDDSSDDDYFTSIAISRLVQQSCLTLGCFFEGNPRVKEFLVLGIQNDRIQQACLAVLFITTQENQYYEQLDKILNDGDTLDYPITLYLREYQEKSSEKIEKLLQLNQQILEKKRKNKKSNIVFL